MAWFERDIWHKYHSWYFKIVEISLVVFMPNITTNHAITYTNQRATVSHIYFTREPKCNWLIWGKKHINVQVLPLNSFPLLASRKCLGFSKFQVISLICCKTNKQIKRNMFSCSNRIHAMTIGHFAVVCSVPWPLTRSEAGSDLVFLQTFLLFMCKSWYSHANKPVNMIIYIWKTT